MSGTPQKMLEHLLETRLGGQVGPNDPFLDDFLLTHIVFMPVPMLINELANLYPFQIHKSAIHLIYIHYALYNSNVLKFTCYNFIFHRKIYL